MTNPLQHSLDNAIIGEEAGAREIGRFSQRIDHQLSDILTRLSPPVDGPSSLSAAFSLRNTATGHPTLSVTSDAPRAEFLEQARQLSDLLCAYGLIEESAAIPPAAEGALPAMPEANGSVSFNEHPRQARFTVSENAPTPPRFAEHPLTQATFTFAEDSPTQITNKLRQIISKLDPKGLIRETSAAGVVLGR